MQVPFGKYRTVWCNGNEVVRRKKLTFTLKYVQYFSRYCVNVRTHAQTDAWGLSKRRRDDGTGDGTLDIDCPGKDYRIGILSKVNNIIYCKNDVLAE